MKILSMLAAVVLVSACETAPETGANSSGTGTSVSTIPPGSQRDLEANVGDRVFFGYDQYNLSPEARGTLDRQSKWLQQYGNVTVTVEGHADERGTREYNLALGERRANAVRNYLVAQGVAAARLKTISYGKERPAVLGSNEASWAQNRRGVTVVD
jgi:peptidoglycan-associated lipoprotein